MSLPNDVTKEMATTPLTRGVNLMCYLLDGITYTQLYSNRFADGTVTSGLGKLMANADALDQHPDLQTDPQGNAYDVKAELVGSTGVLTQIDGMLAEAGYPDIHLGDLFLVKAPKDSPLAKIVSLLQAFFINAGGRMNHFCTPFMYMQDTGEYVSKEDWEDFITGLGALTLGELYQSTNGDVRKHAMRARKNKILIDNSKSVTTHTPGGGNGRWCEDGNCIESGDPNTWCNMVENGSECSAMSDHAP